MLRYEYFTPGTCKGDIGASVIYPFQKCVLVHSILIGLPEFILDTSEPYLVALHSLNYIVFATNEVEVVEDANRLHFFPWLCYYYPGHRDGSACQMAL